MNENMPDPPKEELVGKINKITFADDVVPVYTFVSHNHQYKVLLNSHNFTIVDWLANKFSAENCEVKLTGYSCQHFLEDYFFVIKIEQV